ncbi:phospholipid carrier-dependent glycosyltransferase [Curtobacterium sp. WHRI 8282]|uniref:phospholipid carrier-dependent glycosyltransferase n=1 Tax=Curtobacterium sp. WHRI 8282 TaxID=3162559 RepID=UPI0032EFB36E
MIASHRARRTLDRPRVVRIVAFLVVVAAAVVFAYWHVGRQRVDVDEDVYVVSGWEYLHGVFIRNLEHPPTAKYLFGLAEVVLGAPGPLGPRYVAATASLGTGLLFFLWFRRPVGYWAALIAAALWWLTPRANGIAWGDPGSGVATRMDRTALLEPVMVFFAVAALYAAWRWVNGADRRRWLWAAASGLLLALSVTSKMTSAVLVVAIIALPILFRRWWDLLTGGLIAAGSFVVAFVLLYAPVGFERGFVHMLQFQTGHAELGHSIELLGREYLFAPWWANFVYFTQGTSRWVVLVLVIGLVAAFVFRPDRLVAYLGIGLGAQVAFLTASDVALAHYYYAWMPLLIALAGIGLGRAGWPSRPVSRRQRVLRVTAVCLVLALAVVPVVRLGSAVAQARPAGVARLDAELRARGVDDGTVLFSGYNLVAWRPYFFERGTWEPDADDVVAVVQGIDPRFPMKPGIASYLAAHRDDLEHFTVDELQVWVPKHGALRERDGVLEAVPG